MGVVKVKVMGHTSDVMWPSDVNVGLVSPPSGYCSYARIIHHSEIGVVVTNLAIVWGSTL